MSFKIPNRAKPLSVVQSAPINENLQVIEDVINENLNMSAKINASDKGIPNGVATLDASGKLSTSQIPSSIVTHVFTVKSLYQQLSLSEANIGDICIRQDINTTYVLQNANPSVFSNWVVISSLDGGGEVGGNPPYTTIFNETDWLLTDEGYAIYYEEFEHNQGQSQFVLIDVKNEEGANVICEYSVDSKGNVKLKSDYAFNGSVIISNLQGNVPNLGFCPYTVINGEITNGIPNILTFSQNTIELDCKPIISLIDGFGVTRHIQELTTNNIPETDGEYIIFADSNNIERNILSELTFIPKSKYLGVVDILPTKFNDGDRCYVAFGKSYEAAGDSWKTKACCPLGECTIANANVTNVVTYEYNQNGVDVNYKSSVLNHLFGNEIDGLHLTILNNKLHIDSGKCLGCGKLIEVKSYIEKDCTKSWSNGNGQGAVILDGDTTVYEVLKDNVVYFTDYEGVGADYLDEGIDVYIDAELTDLFKTSVAEEFIYSGNVRTVSSSDADKWYNIYLIANDRESDAIICHNIPEDVLKNYPKYRRIGYAFVENGIVGKLFQSGNKFYYENVDYNITLDSNVDVSMNLTLPQKFMNGVIHLSMDVPMTRYYKFKTEGMLVGEATSNSSIELPISETTTISCIDNGEIKVQVLCLEDLRNEY